MKIIIEFDEDMIRSIELIKNMFNSIIKLWLGNATVTYEYKKENSE